eukprot:814987-Alexandrium_andersonii.AAC.1
MPLLAVFADDRNAVATDEDSMQSIKRIWCTVEMCTALRENVQKRVGWCVQVIERGLDMVGKPAKALGAYLLGLWAAPASNETKVTKASQEARRTAHLLCAWWRRRQVVAGGVARALAWALVIQPLRKIDYKLYNSSVRM